VDPESHVVLDDGLVRDILPHGAGGWRLLYTQPAGIPGANRFRVYIELALTDERLAQADALAERVLGPAPVLQVEAELGVAQSHNGGF